MGKIVAMRNSLRRRKYGELCEDECSLPDTPSLHPPFMCTVAAPSHRRGSAKERVGAGEGPPHGRQPEATGSQQSGAQESGGRGASLPQVPAQRGPTLFPGPWSAPPVRHVSLLCMLGVESG